MMLSSIKSKIILISFLTVSLFLSSLLTFSLKSTLAVQQLNPLQIPVSPPPGPTTLPSSRLSYSIPLPDVFKRAESSIVQITSRWSIPNSTIIINGVPLTQHITAVGSGFVYDSQGHIITTSRLVNGSQTNVTVADGNTYPARLIGDDIYNDIAVLQITNSSFSLNEKAKVVPIILGNSSQVHVRDQVFVIVKPFGLNNTITKGVVTQVRQLLPDQTYGFSIPNVIQTDVVINPKDAGRPLLNIHGQAVGIAIISSNILETNSRTRFAIPSNTIAREVPKLIENGVYVHPLLGISAAEITPDMAQSAGLPRNYTGILVGSVWPGSSADKDGLRGLTQDTNGTKQIGDIIVAVDGHKVAKIDDMISYIDQQKSVGDNITSTVYRNGHILDLNVTLTARPSQLPISVAR